MDSAAQLLYLQQVEESIGGWVFREEASGHYPVTEPFETHAKLTPALWDGGYRFFGDFQYQATFAKFQQCRMDSATMGRDGHKEMCNWGSGGEEKGKARQ